MLENGLNIRGFHYKFMLPFTDQHCILLGAFIIFLLLKFPSFRDILVAGGTAVDSAVAALFCNGVVASQSMGIGGGFLMTIHLANGTTVSLVAREMAPRAASRDMFRNASSTIGPLTAGVPGEVRGYWEAKQRYGNPDISWAQLIKPSIDFCNNGKCHYLFQS